MSSPSTRRLVRSAAIWKGVRAASLAYFDKEPAHLTAAEAALLVAIPRSPERLRPDRHPDAARAARDAVLRRMAAKGVIQSRSPRKPLPSPVPMVRLAMPFHAPHLARALRDAEPTLAVQPTTIDPLLQRRVEIVAAQRTRRPRPACDARCPGHRQPRPPRPGLYRQRRLFPTRRRGTIDMARAVRSPGSALKPFIYAMAFDRLL